MSTLDAMASFGIVFFTLKEAADNFDGNH